MVNAFRWGAVPKKEGEGEKSKEKKKIETNEKRVHGGARREWKGGVGKRHGRNEVTS